MKQEKQFISKKAISDYFKRILTILPLTFLMTPLFYTFFGYHPEIRFFKFLFYLWFAFFIYLGMTLTIVLGKYKNIAYPVIMAVAFILKNIMMFPGLGVAQNLVYSLNPNSFEEDYEMMTGVPMNPDVYLYLAVVVFTTSLIAGVVGALYAKKSALEFVNRGSTLTFVYITIGSGVYFYMSGIWEIDKQAISMYITYLVCLAISYFLVRNFAYLNRQLEVYAERGAYNISGTKKIYAYYFLSLLVMMAALPLLVLVGFVFVPPAVNAISFIVPWLLWLLMQIPSPFHKKIELPPADHVNEVVLAKKPPVESDELMIYYILLGIFLLILFFFRKQIKELISLIIEYFKTKFGKSDNGMNIINQETITEIKKVKKTKTSYKDYLKKAKKIKNLREKFLFAYNYIFWGIIKKDAELKKSATPNEVAGKYNETQEIAKLYQNLKYGQKSEESGEVLTDMTVKAESFICEKL